MLHNKSNILFSFTKCAILSAALLLGLSTSSHAANNQVVPIGHGKATAGPSEAFPDQAPVVSLQFSLVVNPDGTPKGHAKLTSATGWVKFDLTSFVIGIDGRLSAAGPATQVHGSPAFGPDSVAPFFQTVAVGETLFFSAFDNEGLDKPDKFIEGKVPSFLPPFVIEQLRTIQAIQAAIGTAPESIFRHVENGNFASH